MVDSEYYDFDRCGIKKLVVGPLDVNCYILWDRKSREAVIIDPGGDASDIEQEVEDEGLEVRYIINTHGHFDHVGADAELGSALDADIAIHRLDLPLLENVTSQGSLFGLEVSPQPTPSVLLEDGMELKVDGMVIEVIHTPGHTQGGVSLYVKDEEILFTGDTLFAGSIGRTDLPGGCYETLLDSLKEKILPLGDDVRVFPGHGPITTISEEKFANPFVREVL